jgi:hypothetical protein
MVAVAIFSIDPGLRRDLEKLPGDDPAVVIVGMADQLSSLWSTGIASMSSWPTHQHESCWPNTGRDTIG